MISSLTFASIELGVFTASIELGVRFGSIEFGDKIYRVRQFRFYRVRQFQGLSSLDL